MFDTIKTKINNYLTSAKAWFYNSESIFVARATAFFGFLVAALEGMDWSSVLSLNFSNIVNNKQALVAGGLIFFHGIVSEIARRMNSNIAAPTVTP